MQPTFTHRRVDRHTELVLWSTCIDNSFLPFAVEEVKECNLRLIIELKYKSLYKFYGLWHLEGTGTKPKGYTQNKFVMTPRSQGPVPVTCGLCTWPLFSCLIGNEDCNCVENIGLPHETLTAVFCKDSNFLQDFWFSILCTLI